MSGELQTYPVKMNQLEMGYLSGFLLKRLEVDPDDAVARGLYLRLKAAAIASGVEWRYGPEPWEREQ